MTNQKIIIDPEFAASVPPLREEELRLLTDAIMREGCRDALIVWPQPEGRILVDGHHRKPICEANGIPYKTKTIDFPSRDHALLWINEHQRGRRNLSEDQTAMLIAVAVELKSKLEKQNRARKGGEAGGRGRPKQDSLLDNASNKLSPKKEGTLKKLAREGRVPERKVRKALALRKKSPERAQQVQDGKVSLAEAHRETVRTQLKTQLEAVAAAQPQKPVGKFDVLIVDPPWPMKKIEREVRPNQVEFDYPTMSEEELLAFGLPAEHAAKDCHVFLWTTHRFLPLALKCLQQWGFKYICTFVWHKPGGFQPVGLPQFNCEFALYGRKGSPQFVDTKKFNTCFNAPRGEHSEKPEEFYALLRRVTAGRRLDMFNRRRIAGFIGWGKEAV